MEGGGGGGTERLTQVMGKPTEPWEKKGAK